LFLVARVLDTFIDPIIGSFVDRTNSKYGRTRPFILFGIIPFCIMFILTFTTFDLSETGKLIYAYVTYIIVGILILMITNNIKIAGIALITSFSMLVSQVTMIGMVEFPTFRSLALIVIGFISVIFCFVTFTFLSQNLFYPIAILIIKDAILIVAILIKVKIVPNPFEIDGKLLFETFKFGFLPMMTTLLLNINYKMDVIMLRQFEATAIVGIYSVGVTIADYVWLIPDSFKEVLFSRAAKSTSVSPFNTSIKLSLLITSLISVGILIFGKSVITFIYGIEFSNSFDVTIILLIGIPFMSFFKIISPLFVSQGKTKIYFFNLLIGVIINFILNYALIPIMSVRGAALATIVSQFVCGIFALYMYISLNSVHLSDVFILRKNEIDTIKSLLIKK
jgi:O-antigen/teichoic acid export membrane protein